MAAKAPWHSEIWPAIPVITVIERNTIASTTAWVTRNIHTVSPLVNSTTPQATMNAVPSTRWIVIRLESVATWVCDDGGGSTPESGSLARCVWRTFGENTRTPNSTMNGIAGVRLSWIGRSHVSRRSTWG